jgi:MOSC domain-containing protein YiiM
MFISSGHNFFGRHGQPAGIHPVRDVSVVKCRAGWGLEGDRFYGYRPGYNGQITFFAWEDYTALQQHFDLPALSPGAFRRNVVIEGVDLNALIGRRFVLDGVEFEGTSEARPCYWMNQAVAAGAEEWLKGRGGLRAKIVTDGDLHVGAVDLRLQPGGQEAFTFAAPELSLEKT